MNNAFWNYTDKVSISHVREAADRISPYLHRTPVLTSSLLNDLCGKELFFKCEHLQKTGSFKVRGALNACLCLPKDVPGVACYSTGNHGLGLAWAASRLGLKSCVVVARNTPAAKTDVIRSYGASLEMSDPDMKSCRNMSNALAEQLGYAFISNSDNYDVIAGQATIAMELMEQVPDLDAIVASITTGGMCGGMAITAKAIRPDTKIYCVEPKGKELGKSLAARQVLNKDPDAFLPTLAESMRFTSVGYRNFPTLCDLVEPTVLTVSDEDMIQGVRYCWRYLKQVVEPAAGAAVVAAMRDLPPQARRVGVVLSGGNISTDALVLTPQDG